MFMRKLLLVWLLSALVVPALAQFGSNTARRINSGTAAPPATCSSSPVDAYVRTGATLPGLYLCQSANTWSGPLSTSGGTFTGDVYFKSGRPWIDVRAYGAVGDGVADDTAAIQAAINQVTLGGPMASQGLEVYFPQGTYKITNSLFYEGNVSRGVHFLGEHGATRGPVGARLWYQGPANGTLFFVLGANATDFDHLDFDGGSLAKYIVRLDATNEYSSSTVWNISSISRASNLVTVTTTAAHNLGSGDTVQIAGVTDTSYNGTYLVT